jgi:glycosyltransferase involved in cell wall biosynthesis
MNNSKLVNVVVDTYNRHHQLKQALESVETQTYKHLKVWVVSDGHDPIVEQITQEFNSRLNIPYVYMHTPKHYGAWGTMSKKMGILQTNDDEYVFCLDDDNVLYPNYVEDLVEVFNEDCGIVYGNVDCDDRCGEVIPGYDCNNIFEKARIDQLCYMIKSSIAKKCVESLTPCFLNDFYFINECSHYTNSIYVNKKIGCHKSHFSLPTFPIEYLTDEDIQFYQDLIQIRVPNNGKIAEIGYWQNGSLYNMCKIVKLKDIKISLIDMCDYDINNPSETIINFPNNYFNLIFIDIKNNYKNMLLNWFPKLKSKGVFCGYYNEDVNQIIVEIFGRKYNIKKNIWYTTRG